MSAPARRPLVRAHAAAALAVLALAACAPPAPARAAAIDDGAPRLMLGPAGRIPGTTVNESDLPLYFAFDPQATPARPRPMPPLSPAAAMRLRHAVDLRTAGLAAHARDTLLALARDVPHHPLVVTELARTEIALEHWDAVFSLLVSERSAARDSTLGSHELELACERLQRTRAAAQTAIETWVAAPWQAGWSMPLLLRLMGPEPKATLEMLRAVHVRDLSREDLARGYALLLGRTGQPQEAARVLAESDRGIRRSSLRERFADEAMSSGLRADSLAALESLTNLVAEPGADPQVRQWAARRALEISPPMGLAGTTAPRVERGLADLPLERWESAMLLSLARALRASGHDTDARALLERSAQATRLPELALEHALDVLREGPPARALRALDSLADPYPPARFLRAEAEFFAGDCDSAHAHYQAIAKDVASPDAVRALDRLYLLEEQPGASELDAFGQLAYLRWRGDASRARALADSLDHALPLASPFYAPAALQLAELCAESKDWKAALAPLSVVSDSLPGDRLAPLARQRAGEAWLALGDDRRAVQTLEDCLARYPKAWNAPEVRRRLEQLRRERHL